MIQRVEDSLHLFPFYLLIQPSREVLGVDNGGGRGDHYQLNLKPNLETKRAFVCSTEKQKQGYEMPDPLCPLLRNFHRLLCCFSEDPMNSKVSYW